MNVCHRDRKSSYTVLPTRPFCATAQGLSGHCLGRTGCLSNSLAWCKSSRHCGTPVTRIFSPAAEFEKSPVQSRSAHSFNVTVETAMEKSSATHPHATTSMMQPCRDVAGMSKLTPPQPQHHSTIPQDQQTPASLLESARKTVLITSIIGMSSRAPHGSWRESYQESACACVHHQRHLPADMTLRYSDMGNTGTQSQWQLAGHGHGLQHSTRTRDLYDHKRHDAG